MSDQANGGGGDDVGASPTKGIPGTPLKNGQTYTARGKGVKVINEPKVAKWIWANYGAPLKKAKAHVVKLQKSGSIMVAQLQECRAALQAAGLSAPDYGMPDFATPDLDLSDVSDDDIDDYSADDYLSGAHDAATAATVAGIVGGADDAHNLGATLAERRAQRAAIAAKRGARSEHAHVKSLQKMGSHLVREVEELKAELAHARAQNRDHALVHQMERALAYAIRALEAENVEMQREMISPAGSRMGFPGGYGDPRTGLAGAPSASGMGLAGVPPYVPGSGPAPLPAPEAGDVGCAPCTGLGPSVGPAPYYPGYPLFGSGGTPYTS